MSPNALGAAAQAFVAGLGNPATRACYTVDLGHLETFLGGDAARATAAQLRAFRAAHERAGFAPSTLSRRLACLRTFYRWLHDERGKPDIGHALGTVKDDRGHPTRPPEPANLARLVRHISRRQDPASQRDLAVVRLLVGCGLRASELVALDAGDVAAGYVVVRGPGGRERQVPLTREADTALAPLLAAAHAAGREALFVNLRAGERMSRQWVTLMLHRQGAASGIGPVSAEELRAAFGRDLFKAGADERDVQRLMGHVNVESTRRFSRVA